MPPKISETRIRELVAEGKMDTEIAEEFGCSPSAVQRRRANMGLPAASAERRVQNEGPLKVIDHHIPEIFARPWV